MRKMAVGPAWACFAALCLWATLSVSGELEPGEMSGSVGAVVAGNTVSVAHKPSVVWTGAYSKYGVVEEIRYGATVLMSPRTAATAEFVFSYDPQIVFKSGVRLSTLKSYLASKHLKIGKVKGSVIDVKAASDSGMEPIIVKLMEAIREGYNANQDEFENDLYIVSSSAMYGKVTANSTWIGWQLGGEGIAKRPKQ